MERYQILKEVILNIDEVISYLRLPQNGLYSDLLNLHKRLRGIEEQSVENIISCLGVGTNDVSFTKNILNLAETKSNLK